MRFAIEKAALSDREAAQYLGISRTGLWRLLKSGALPPCRIGGRTLVRRTDLDALLDRSVRRAPSSPAS